MKTGTVKWFNDNKGYGFIEQPDGPDVFVRWQVIECVGFKALAEGETVQFEDTVTAKHGPEATRVVKGTK